MGTNGSCAGVFTAAYEARGGGTGAGPKNIFRILTGWLKAARPESFPRLNATEFRPPALTAPPVTDMEIWGERDWNLRLRHIRSRKGTGTDSACQRHSCDRMRAVCLFKNRGCAFVRHRRPFYDTLRTVTGQNGAVGGTFKDYGIGYREVALKDGGPDLAAIEQAAAGVKAVYIQRSRGYGQRRALTVGDIGDICRLCGSITLRHISS